MEHIARLEGERRLAEERVDSLKVKTQEAKEQLKEAEAGRVLSRFIQERSESGDYRKNLGIIGQIHQDFKKLQELLEKASPRKAPVKNDDRKQSEDEKFRLAHIDRIVLYIDDLDRCPPDRVVEVIQAVHLLLALKLFVVVVAVDPKWVARALEQHPDLLLSDGNSDEKQVPIADDLYLRVTGLQAEEEQEWDRATPESYFEKIFQIPYTLGDLNSEGYEELVSHLTVPASETHNTRTEEPTKEIGSSDNATAISAAKVVDNSNSNSKSSTATMTEPNAEEKPTEADEVLPSAPLSIPTGGLLGSQSPEEYRLLNPRRVVLTGTEREFLARMSPFIRTPRAAKRLVNSYRLVRATLQDGALEEFLEKHEEAGYKAAIILLAAATGMPQVAQKFFQVVRSENDQSIYDAISNPLFKGAITAVRRRLTGRIPVKMPTYRRWEPSVRRYAFYL